MIKKTLNWIKHECAAHELGAGFNDNEQHHFFGYYNKTPWHLEQNKILGQQYESMDANLVPELEAQVGYFDLDEGGRFIELDSTTTWNWQMGAQLQWLGNQEQKNIIFNVRSTTKSGRYPSFSSRILNIEDKESRDLDIPIYSVAPDGSYAVTVDYRRLYVTHETIGYSEPEGKANDLELYPEDDGLVHVDITTGESKVIVSYADLCRFNHRESMVKALHWISHIEVNPNSKRILFLHRWTERVEDETCFLHRLITINPDGSDIRLLECSDHPLPQLEEDFDPNAVGTYDYEKSEYQISHPFWKDNNSIIVWGPHDGSIHYHLYQDNDLNQVEIIGKGVLTENGHMSYSPVDQRWLLTDTYPDSETNIRKLLIFDTQEEIVYEIGEFYTPDLKKENRCDLHPRWHPSGMKVCIDSVHEGKRQMYLIDVSTLVK